MKLSMDLIAHLEKKGTLRAFIDEYETIYSKNPAYANTFAGMLEISRGLNLAKADYLIIGGLSVAAYLHQFDSEAFGSWRGTSDIDLLVTDKNIGTRVLKSADYDFAQVRPSRIGMKGLLYDYTKEDNGETTVVGLRTGIMDKAKRDVTKKLLTHSAIIPVHGVRVAVPQLGDLIKMKKWANRKRDREDIASLKYLLESA